MRTGIFGCLSKIKYNNNSKFSSPIPKQALVFMCLHYKSFENTVGKGEIALIEQFLPFPQCFLPVWRTFSFQLNMKLLMAISFSLEV